MKILVTGFEPFFGAEINPSKILSQRMSQNFSEVESLILPVEFDKSSEFLKKYIAECGRCDYLVMLGQAAGRSKISLEKIGLNWVQSNHKDESGVLPQTGIILEDEPLALMSIFPIDEVYSELRKENLPVEISFSAGTFVCNDLYYRILNQFSDLKAVFIHVPLTEDMDINQQTIVLSRIIEIILQR